MTHRRTAFARGVRYRLLGGLIGVLAASPATAAPEKIDQLVVRMWPGPWGDAMKAVGQAFTDQTGIPVLYDGRTDGVMGTLVQSAQAQGNRPPVDVFYTFDIDAFRDSASGMFVPLSAAKIPNLDAMLPQAKPPGSGSDWPFVAVGADVVTLLYRADKFPNGPPTSLNVLFDPAFKGRVFFYNQEELAIGIVALVNGWKVPADMDKIWSFFAAKVKPMEPLLGNDPDLVGGFQRDEVDIAMSYPTIAEQLKGIGIRWTKAKEGLVGGNEVVAIPKGLPPANQYWAERYINVLLSADVLSRYCDTLMIACYRKDMPAPKGAAGEVIPSTPEELTKIFTIPMDAYAAHQSEWSARYDEILK